MPLARHSPLPELQEFVKLFRPKKVVPNTLDPRLLNLDWAYIERQFAPFLHHSTMGTTMHIRERLAVSRGDCLDSATKNDVDVAFKNLVGDGASEIAQRWADQGKLMKKIELLKKSLDNDDQRVIDELCGLLPPSAGTDKGKGVDVSFRDGNDSDCESYDSGEAHDGIANLFWVGSDDKENSRWAPSSPLMMEEEILTKKNENVSPTGKGNRASGIGAHRINRLTPESSPIRTRKPRPTNSKQALPSVPTTPPEHRPTHRISPEPQHDSHGRGRSLTSPIVLSSSPATLPPDVVTKILQPVFKVKEMHLPSRTSVISNVPAPEIAPRKSKAIISATPQLPLLTNAQASSSKPRHVRQFLIQPSSKSPQVSSLPMKPVKRSASEVVSDFPRPQKKGKFQDRSPAKSKSVPQDSATLSQLLRSTKSPPSASKQEARMLRLNLSTKLAEAYPNLVKPSHSEKKMKRLGLAGNRSQSDDVVTKSSSAHGAALSASVCVNDISIRTPPRPKTLQPAKTLPCFDENDDKAIDWNRSGLLAEAVRRDIKLGRVPSLPSLECLGADSQSPVMK